MSEPADPRRLHPVPNNDHDQPTQQPPQNIEAEQAVLGAILLAGTTVLPTLATRINPADFYQPRHETIYRAAINLYARGEPIDTITISAELARTSDTNHTGGPAYLFQLLNNTTTHANADYYAQLITAAARDRRLIETGTRLVQLGYTASTGDPTERLTQARQWINDALDDTPHAARTDPRLQPAGAFLYDDDGQIDALWGHADNTLWVRGETLILAGPQGSGKTTLAQQVVLHRIGARTGDLLGLPVAPCQHVLYLAMDRPMQAKRSLRRMTTPADRPYLDQHLTIWKGPPPATVVANTRALLDLAHQAGLGEGDCLVVDSVKDVAVGIASDEVGAAVNTALQELLAAGIDVLALHHPRKRAGDATMREPESIDELYGSTFITAGAGSVISLFGQPGDPIVKFKHLKQPAEPVGPFELLHDHVRGVTTIDHGVDVLELVKWQRGSGLTAAALAVTLFGVEDREPDKTEIAKARRKLDALVRSGHLVRQDGDTSGRGGRGNAARWFLAANPSSAQEPA